MNRGKLSFWEWLGLKALGLFAKLLLFAFWAVSSLALLILKACNDAAHRKLFKREQ